MFRNKEVTLALGWPMTLNALQKAGFNVKAVIPEEGATGWVDQLMVVKGSKNIELGQLWLDYITQPEIMAKVAATTTYSVAHPGAAAHISEALKKSTDAGNEKYYLDRLNWWQWVKDRTLYDEVIRAVKADQ
jgi:spermidine/putrescine-binding protein